MDLENFQKFFKKMLNFFNFFFKNFEFLVIFCKILDLEPFINLFGELLGLTEGL